MAAVTADSLDDLVHSSVPHKSTTPVMKSVEEVSLMLHSLPALIAHFMFVLLLGCSMCPPSWS